VIKKIVKTPEPEPEPAKKTVKPTPKTDVKVEPKPTPKVLPPIEPSPIVPDTKARDEARAREVARMNQLSQATTVSVAASAAPVVGPPQAGSAQGLGAGWAAKLKACVQPRLNYRDNNGDNPRVVIVVALSSTGSPSNPVVSKSSGNPVFDDAVARALLGCNPFPKPDSGIYPPSVPVAYRLND
jgi:colicin import membrane protein